MTWTNLVPWDLTILQGISSLPKANSHGSKCSLRVPRSVNQQTFIDHPLCTIQLAGFYLKLFWPLENLPQKSISRTIAVWRGHIGVRLQNQGSGVPDVNKDFGS